MGDVQAATSPSRMRNNKRLRKRRELDALVQGSSRRTSMSSSKDHTEQSGVLRSTEDEDDDEDQIQDEGVGLVENGFRNRRSHRRLLRDSGGKNSSHSQSAPGSPGWLMRRFAADKACAVLCRVFLVVMCLTAFLALYVQLRSEIVVFRKELEKVISEREEIQGKYQSVTSQLQNVISNQTQNSNHDTAADQQLAQLVKQVQSINGTLSEVQSSLKAAPELKTLPQEVDDIKNDLAKFGSKLTELEEAVGKAKTLRSAENDNEIQKLSNATSELRSDLSTLTDVTKKIESQIADDERANKKNEESLKALANSVTSIQSSMQKSEDKER